MFDDALLKTINEIAKAFEQKMYFQDFDQASTKESIVKFVLNYFHTYKGIDIKDITKFKDLIEFLAKKSTNESFHEKINTNQSIELHQNVTNSIEATSSRCIQEPKFKILVFNFKTPELAKVSAISFYSNFLNFYFLKKSRQDLYDRCCILLKKKISKTSEQDCLLRKWTTYVDLCDIINYTKTGKATFFINEQIIDESFLDKCPKNERLPDVIYYQLQFIFNFLDSNVPQFPLFEKFLIALYKVQQVDLEEKDFIKIITQSIIVKNISFILQKKNYEKVIQKESQSIIDSNTSRVSEGTEYSIEDDFASKTFIERLRTTMKNKKIKQIKFIPFENFWNRSDANFEFGKDIFFNNVDSNKKSEDDWEAGIGDFSTERGLAPTKNEKFVYPPTNPSNTKGKLYKIFYYNEALMKWQKSSDDYNNFFENNNIKIKNSKTPLIYFSNSKEDDLENLVSKLINNSYPNLDDDQIYVYGFCDKSLQSIAGDMTLSEENGTRKPILLILHVPKAKENLPNIKTIIYQISTFLSFICDIEIIVLNKKHYINQINRVIEVENIKRSYSNASELLSIKTPIEEFEDFKDDLDDDFESDSGKPNLRDENINDVETAILSELSEEIFKKSHKLLFILDDDSFEYKADFEFRKAHNQFINSMKNKVFHNSNKVIPNFTVINLKDTNSYKGFRDIFINFTHPIKTESKEVITNFNCIHISNMSSIYFKLKSKADYTDELGKISQDRFQMLEIKKLNDSPNLDNQDENEEENENDQNDDLRHLSGFSILFDLQKELYSICPPMDLHFCSVCNTVIKKIESKVAINKDDIKKELEASYSYIITKLINSIHKRPYWTDKAKFDLKLSFDQHLHDEYFDIIYEIFPPKEAAVVYQNEENFEVLNSMIKIGIEKLDAEFKNKEEEIAEMKNQKGQELKDKIKKGANYHIREIENENEFKLTVEVGQDIDDYIDHDF